jgi:hypothetical protein
MLGHQNGLVTHIHHRHFAPNCLPGNIITQKGDVGTCLHIYGHVSAKKWLLQVLLVVKKSLLHVWLAKHGKGSTPEPMEPMVSKRLRSLHHEPAEDAHLITERWTIYRMRIRISHCGDNLGTFVSAQQYCQGNNTTWPLIA